MIAPEIQLTTAAPGIELLAEEPHPVVSRNHQNAEAHENTRTNIPAPAVLATRACQAQSGEYRHKGEDCQWVGECQQEGRPICAEQPFPLLTATCSDGCARMVLLPR